MNENWKFSDIPYARPDVKALQARYDALTRRAKNAACAGDLLDVVRARDALEQEVALCQSLVTIRAFHDVTDEFYQKEYQETLPRLETLDSQSLGLAIAESPYAPAVDATFGPQLRRLLENDRQPNVSTGQSGGGVQIMSIHRSKGLEFPVVILADLNKQFNEQDLKRPVLVHPALGLGCERVDRARHIRYDSVSKSALALTLRREAKAEEMRILYVALTRAKEKLICIDCMKRAGARVRDLAAIGSYPAEPEAVASARALGDWLLLPLLQSVQAEPIRRWAGLDAEHLQDAVGWEVFLWENPTRQTAAPSAAPVPAQRAGEELPFDEAQLDWVYPHAASAVIPSKVTATQLKGRALDQEIAENAAPERRVRAVSFEKPRFLQKERGLTAAERGTAMHAVMQYLDFARPADEQSVREQVMQLQERRLLTPEQAAAIDVHEIAQFLCSPLAQRIRQAETLYREYRFALLVPATLYDPKVDEREQMMLQGVVDCCFDTPEGLVIVDFKTDRVRLGQEPERAEVYRPQLEAYSRALSRVLERNISERILYFFATGQEISL